ncbi:hypothetical protein E2C01_027235 [Portunus trituberculatus]|uniref:Uncharacterized protein n=1 Tax=Portunus trituberculatus TaxID=210409 RepID=A0A5B7EL46_PORTR|nr:hypothetical protein [Portunus trituberculatus]
MVQIFISTTLPCDVAYKVLKNCISPNSPPWTGPCSCHNSGGCGGGGGWGQGWGGGEKEVGR